MCGADWWHCRDRPSRQQVLIQPSDAVSPKVFDAIEFSTICREGAARGRRRISANLHARSIPGAGSPPARPAPGACAKSATEPRGLGPRVTVTPLLSLPRQRLPGASPHRVSSLWLFKKASFCPTGELGEVVALGLAGDREMEKPCQTRCHPESTTVPSVPAGAVR